MVTTTLNNYLYLLCIFHVNRIKLNSIGFDDTCALFTIDSNVHMNNNVEYIYQELIAWNPCWQGNNYHITEKQFSWNFTELYPEQTDRPNLSIYSITAGWGHGIPSGLNLMIMPRDHIYSGPQFVLISTNSMRNNWYMDIISASSHNYCNHKVFNVVGGYRFNSLPHPTGDFKCVIF